MARRWLALSAGASALALVVAAMVVSAGGEPPAATAAGCSGAPLTVAVTASAGVYPALERLAAAWAATRPVWRGRCLTARVTPRRSDQVLSALSPDWDASLGGPRPDVWVPDSSLWLSLAAGRPATTGMLPSTHPSLATSPVVLALREPLARALGWPGRAPGWSDVIQPFIEGWAQAGHPEWGSLRMGMTDVATSTPGLAALLAILGDEYSAAPPASPDSVTSAVSGNQAAGDPSVVDSARLVDTLRFSQALGATAPDDTGFFAAQAAGGRYGSIAAFPALESEVAAYDAANSGHFLVPVYAAPQVVADFPYTVLSAPWVDAGTRAAAAAFLAFLQSDTGQDAFGVSGLRGPDHTVRDPAALPVTEGFPAGFDEVQPDPASAVINEFVSDWTSLQRPSNMLVVLDTSGSMADPVPGTSTTRLQLMRQTASTGCDLLADRNNIGLWDFSDRSRAGEYRELVPFGPSTGQVGGVQRRRAMLDALDDLHAEGGTPLYDTVYAAFHEMQGHWQAGAINAVLVITDGSNDTPGGLTLDELVAKLTGEQRKDRPVQVINIALGPEADADALRRISGVTGGRTFVARDPASAQQTLVLAFAGRLS